MPLNTVKVSVVMPVYNGEKYIEVTIRSVLAQTFGDFELLVIDDCSKDGTTALVEQFVRVDSRVSLIRLPSNCGAPAGPRNVGVRAARGEWIAFLDADDIWHPGKLACQLEALGRSGARFCSARMVDFRDEATLRFTDPGVYRLIKIGFLRQLLKFQTPTSSVVVSRDVITCHPFDERMSFKAREDLDCWLHCHEALRWSVKVDHPLVGYRIVAGQISGRKWQMVRRHYHVLREYRLQSGAGLGVGAALFTVSHFALALYYRLVKKGL